MTEWPEEHVAAIGPLKLHSVFNWVEEGGVDLEREVDGNVGHNRGGSTWWVGWAVAHPEIWEKIK
jgi:hypothetical protein